MGGLSQARRLALAKPCSPFAGREWRWGSLAVRTMGGPETTAMHNWQAVHPWQSGDTGSCGLPALEDPSTPMARMGQSGGMAAWFGAISTGADCVASPWAAIATPIRSTAQPRTGSTAIRTMAIRRRMVFRTLLLDKSSVKGALKFAKFSGRWFPQYGWSFNGCGHEAHLRPVRPWPGALPTSQRKWPMQPLRQPQPDRAGRCGCQTRQLPPQSRPGC